MQQYVQCFNILTFEEDFRKPKEVFVTTADRYLQDDIYYLTTNGCVCPHEKRDEHQIVFSTRYEAVQAVKEYAKYHNISDYRLNFMSTED